MKRRGRSGEVTVATMLVAMWVAAVFTGGAVDAIREEKAERAAVQEREIAAELERIRATAARPIPGEEETKQEIGIFRK